MEQRTLSFKTKLHVLKNVPHLRRKDLVQQGLSLFFSKQDCRMRRINDLLATHFLLAVITNAQRFSSVNQCGRLALFQEVFYSSIEHLFAYYNYITLKPLTMLSIRSVHICIIRTCFNIDMQTYFLLNQSINHSYIH